MFEEGCLTNGILGIFCLVKKVVNDAQGRNYTSPNN